MPLVLASPWRIGLHARFDWTLRGTPKAILLPKSRFVVDRVAAADIAEVRGLTGDERSALAASLQQRAARSHKATDLLQQMHQSACVDALVMIRTHTGDEFVMACRDQEAMHMLQLTAQDTAPDTSGTIAPQPI